MAYSRSGAQKAVVQPYKQLDKEAAEAGPLTKCVLLNRDQDARLQYTVPVLPCMPCSLNFTFSMKAKAGEYIAFGFKEYSATYGNWATITSDMQPHKSNWCDACQKGAALFDVSNGF